MSYGSEMFPASRKTTDGRGDAILPGLGVPMRSDDVRLTSEQKRTTLSDLEDSPQGGSKGRSGEMMERWRSYFAKAGADIWIIIEQAIVLAAIDYPQDFKEKRSAIAETLFARTLLQLHSGDTDATRLSGSIVTDATNRIEENEVRNDGEDTRVAAVVARSGEDSFHCSYDDAEALTDVIEEEALLLKELYSIKDTIKDIDQSESTILDSLQRLTYMQISVEALKASEIGRQVNGLRKHSSKRVRSIVRSLVRTWKDLVDEWVKSVGDVNAAGVAGSDGGNICKAGNEDQGLPLPPLDEGALLAARTPSLEMAQLFSFMDDDICGQANGKEEVLFNLVEPSIKDNLYNPWKSQTGSILTHYSDCNAKASTNCDWDFRVPEERGSTTRDFHSGISHRRPELVLRGSTSQCGDDLEEFNQLVGLSVTKSVMGGSGPGRPSQDIPKVRSTPGAVTGRSTNDPSKINRSHALQRTSGTDINNDDKSSKLSTANRPTIADKSQGAQRLEAAKKKLHEGYQQAENAKKQRTVQLMDFPDLPKAVQMRGKVYPPVQSKTASQSGQWSQNRRHG